MIPLSVGEIAAIVGGVAMGDPDVVVTAPAVLDSRHSEPGGLLVAFAGRNVDGHDFAVQAAARGAVAVLGSRPTELPTVVVDDAEVALQTLARHLVSALRDDLTVVAVTGSQGKTSTKDLMNAVFSSVRPTVATIGNFNNELGAPITMTRAEGDTRFLVLEMGARHIGDIARLTDLAAPDVAVVLNVGMAHVGEFGSQDAIALGKSELVRGLAAGGTAVLNADDPRVSAMRSLTTGPVLTFGQSADADIRVHDLTLDPHGRPSFTLTTADDSHQVSLPLVGAHQALNAAAAVAAARACGIPLSDAAAALGAVALSKWRMEVSELATGVTLINDSYNSSPGSVRAALDSLAAIHGVRHVALLGQILELGDRNDDEHHEVGVYAATRADIVLAVGTNARQIAVGAGERGLAVADNTAAIGWLRSNLVAGDVVLVKASRGAHLDEIAAALSAPSAGT
jgi:UDP-N-acetylmuramoyl-tripeptide--D-alanyl-D-alanine ligase